MPINIDRFEGDPEDTLDIEEGTQPHTIFTFLAANNEQAFTQTEIHEGTDIPRGSVGVVLSRLEERGLVRHRGRYWAIAEDERLASYAAQQAASSASTTDNYEGETDE
jgi:DNA-binding IclR family transcriptional regulator